MDTILPSQPLAYKQLLKASLKLYRASFTKTLFLAILLSIVVFIPRLISDIIGQDIFLHLQPLSPHRLWMIVIDIASLIFFIAILWRMHCVNRGFHEPLIEDFSKGVKKILYVLVAGLITSAIIFAIIAITVGLQLLLDQYHLLFSLHPIGILITITVFVGQFLLLIYISTLFIFYLPIIAIENQGIITSLERSVLLGWNHWWKIFSTQITPWILYIVLLYIVRYVFRIDIHIYLIEHSEHSVWSTLLHICIFVLYIPWVASLLLTQLHDLELRKRIVSKI